MSNVHINLGSALEQPLQRIWNRKRGYSSKRSWKAQQSDAEALRDSLIASGLYTDVNLTEGPVWTVEATADSDVSEPGGTPNPETTVIDTWELSANRVEKDLLASDSALVSGFSASDLKKLRAFAAGNKNWDTDAWDGTASGNEEKVYQLMRLGWRSKTVIQPVIRKNINVSNSYVIPGSLTNVMKVYKTSTLLGAESIPASISNNLEASASSTKDGLTFWTGWLKGYPTITDTSDGRVQLQQEWEWGLWSNDAYSVI